MKKSKFILDRNNLYKVIKTNRNQIYIEATNEPITKEMARYTYPKNQLETLGYVFFESGCLR